MLATKNPAWIKYSRIALFSVFLLLLATSHTIGRDGIRGENRYRVKSSTYIF